VPIDRLAADVRMSSMSSGMRAGTAFAAGRSSWKARAITLALGLAMAAAFGAWWTGGDHDSAVAAPVADASDAETPVDPPGSGLAIDGGLNALASATAAIAAERRATLERLQASGDPRDAWHAYDLVHQCVEWQRAERRMARDPEARVFLRQAAAPYDGACIGVEDGVVAGRLALLRRAAEGHVPGAAAALFNEGPRGDGRGLESPAEWVAWWARCRPLLVASVDAGDRSALSLVAQVLENGIPGGMASDPAGALTYDTVVAELARQRHGGELPASFQGALDHLGAQMSPDERARARAAGLQLFVDVFQGKPAQ
jgi:hypothetical protein